MQKLNFHQCILKFSCPFLCKKIAFWVVNFKAQWTKKFGSVSIKSTVRARRIFSTLPGKKRSKIGSEGTYVYFAKPFGALECKLLQFFCKFCICNTLFSSTKFANTFSDRKLQRAETKKIAFFAQNSCRIFSPPFHTIYGEKVTPYIANQTSNRRLWLMQFMKKTVWQ